MGYVSIGFFDLFGWFGVGWKRFLTGGKEIVFL